MWRMPRAVRVIESRTRAFVAWLGPLLGALVFLVSAGLLLNTYEGEAEALIAAVQDRGAVALLDLATRRVHVFLIPLILGVLVTVLTVSLSREAALRRSHRRLRNLLEHTGDAIVVIDQKGAVRYLNAAADALFGGPRAPTPEALLDESGVAWLERAVGGGGPATAAVGGLAPGGKALYLEATLSPFEVAEGRWHSILLRDLTVRKALEARQAAQARLLAHLHRSQDGRTLGEGIFAIARGEVPGLRGASLWMVESGRAREWARLDGPPAAGRRLLEGREPAGGVLRVPGPPEPGDPEWGHLASGSPPDSVRLRLDLAESEAPLGGLDLVVTEDAAEAAEALLEFLGDPLATAVGRLRAAEAAATRLRRLDHAIGFAQRLATVERSEELVSEAVRRLAAEFGFRRGWLYRRRGSRLVPTFAGADAKLSEAPAASSLPGGGLILEGEPGVALVGRVMTLGGEMVGALAFEVGDNPVGDEEALLAAFASQTAVALSHLDGKARLERSFAATLQVVGELLEMRYSGAERAGRVARRTASVAQRLGIPDRRCQALALAARIHLDGGQGAAEALGDAAASEPGGEAIGVRARHQMDDLKEITRAIAHHNERFDGTGHPAGLKGEEIPTGARIVSLVEAYEALTSPPPQGEGRSPDAALRLLDEVAGTQFDPQALDALRAVLAEEP